MVLPAGRSAMFNFRGPQGLTGVLASLDVELLPWNAQPYAEMTGSLEARGAILHIPMPLPAPETVNNDDATEGLVKNPTKTRTAVRAEVDSRTALVTSLTPTPYRKPRKPRASGFQETFQTGHAWTLSGTGATLIPNDLLRHWEGFQAASITSPASAGAAVLQFQKGGLALADMTSRCLRVALKIDRPDLVNQLNIFIGSSGFASTFSWRPTVALKPNEPTEITLPWSAFLGTTGTFARNPDGTPSTRSGFEAIRVQVIPIASRTDALTVTLQRVEPISDQRQAFPNGAVVIATDDGRTDLFTQLRPLLRARGQRATHYVICESIGTGAPFLSEAQLRQLHDEGDEIGLHAYAAAVHSGSSGNGYADSTEAAARLDLARGRGWLRDRVYPADSFAWPKGAYGYTTDGVPLTKILADYFQTGRTTGGLVADTFPPASLPRVNAVTGVGEMGPAVGTPAALTSPSGLISRAKNNGDLVVLVFHQITTGAPTVSEQCSVAGLTAILDYIQSSGVEVLTMREVMARTINVLPE